MVVMVLDRDGPPPPRRPPRSISISKDEEEKPDHKENEEEEEELKSVRQLIAIGPLSISYRGSGSGLLDSLQVPEPLRSHTTTTTAAAAASLPPVLNKARRVGRPLRGGWRARRSSSSKVALKSDLTSQVKPNRSHSGHGRGEKVPNEKSLSPGPEAVLLRPLFGTRTNAFELYSRTSTLELIFHQKLLGGPLSRATFDIQFASVLGLSRSLHDRGNRSGSDTKLISTVADYLPPADFEEDSPERRQSTMASRFEVDKFMRLIGLISFCPLSGSPRTWSAQLNYFRMWIVSILNWVFATRSVSALLFRNDQFLFYSGDFTQFFRNGDHIFYSFPIFMYAVQGAFTFQLYLNEEISARETGGSKDSRNGLMSANGGGSGGGGGGKTGGHYGMNNKSRLLPWLEIFEVARGHRPPRELHLDGANGDRFIRKISGTFAFVQRACLLVVLLSVAWACSAYWDRLSGRDYLLIGLPWSVLSAIWFLHLTAHTLTSAALFYLLCYYLWMRFTQFNGRIMRAYGPIVYPDRHGAPRSGEFSLVDSAVQDFDQACHLLHRLDDFWSSALTCIYFVYTPSICFLLYLLLFTSPDQETLIVILATTLLSLAILSYYLLPPALVNLLAHKHYVQLNSVNSKGLPVPVKQNLLTLIERLGGIPVGFTCGELFVVTVSSFVNSLMMIGTYFLLIVDFAQSKARKTAQNKAMMAAAAAAETEDALAAAEAVLATNAAI